MDAQTQEKVNQLSVLQQNLQQIMLQKQQFQSRLFELESADKEVKESSECYKIIGNIMVKTDKLAMQEEIVSKTTSSKVRLESFEKQEQKLKLKADELQQEILRELKSDGTKNDLNSGK